LARNSVLDRRLPRTTEFCFALLQDNSRFDPKAHGVLAWRHRIRGLFGTVV
jgi:hypothetical protein